MSEKSSIKNFLIKRWSLVFLLILLAFFSIFGTGFSSIANIQDIFLAATTTMLLGIGQTFVIITGGIDLSVGFTMGLSSVIMATLVRDLTANGVLPVFSILLGIGLSMVVGIATGLVNGYLVAFLKVPAFIATLGMYGVAYGLALIRSGGFPVGNLPAIVGSLGNRYLFYILPGEFFSLLHMPEGVEPTQLRNVMRILPLVVIVVLIIAGLFIIILSKTQFGKHTYAIGGDEDVARRAGVKVKSHLMKIYVISSLFAAMGGISYTFRFGSGNAQAGAAQMLMAIATVVIGGASLYGGTGDIQGTIVGALIIGTLQIGMVFLGVQPFYQFIVIGLIIIFGVLLDQLSQRKYLEIT